MNDQEPVNTGGWRRALAGIFIDLRGLPDTLKLLVAIGYLAVLGQLLFTLLAEKAGDRLPVVLYSIGEDNYKVPLLILAVSGLAFIVGWAYLLAGAAAAKARIFLSVLALFALQLFLVTGGNLLLVFLELVFFLVVFIIYGLTFRTNFWPDLPGLHFFGWLAAVTVIMVFSIGLSPSNAIVAIALSTNFTILQILTFAFWLILGLSVIDLGVSIGRGLNRFARTRLPLSTFTSLIVFILLFHPAVIALVFWLTQDGFLLFDVVFSLLLLFGGVVVWIAQRWSASTGSVLLTLSFAAPVVALGLSMAFAGNDFTQLLLNMTGIFPPTLLFVGLTTYNLFGMGPSFTGVDGRILPRRSRIFLYFGALLLVVACMLFRTNDRYADTNLLSLDIQSWVNNVFALSALFIGLPYIVWLVWKRRDKLIGPESDFSEPPRWDWLNRIPGKAWFALSVILACASSCLLLGLLFSLVK